MLEIGVIAGAFDPIHNGHIQLALSLLSSLSLQKVMMVPTAPQPYLRCTATFKHRKAMVKAAIKPYPNILMPDFQFKSAEPDAYEVILAACTRYPDAKLYYAVGADHASEIPYWRNLPYILEHCELVICPRAGYDTEQMATFAGFYGAKVQVAAIKDAGVSTETIRDTLTSLDDASDVLPHEVACYIASFGLYQPDYESMLKPILTPHRLEHSLSVRHMAVSLAYKHGACMQKASVAGILHDCAKCMRMARQQEIAKQQKLTKDPAILNSASMLHGLVGAHIAKTTHHIEDEDVLNAIRYHTTGRSGMSVLELCIFVADTIEPRRVPFPGIEDIRDLAMIDLKAAAYACMKSTKKYVLSSGNTYFPQTDSALEDLGRQLASI